MRGRVAALYLMVFMGGTPLGAPLIGWIGEEFGARWTMIIGGALSAAGIAVATALYARHQQLSARGRISPAVRRMLRREGFDSEVLVGADLPTSRSPSLTTTIPASTSSAPTSCIGFGAWSSRTQAKASPAATSLRATNDANAPAEVPSRGDPRDVSQGRGHQAEQQQRDPPGHRAHGEDDR